MPSATSATTWRTHWWPILTITALGIGVAGAVLVWYHRQTLLPSASEPSARRPAFASPGMSSYLRPSKFYDSGYDVVNAFILPIKDPFSLEHIRDCYQGAGQRGIKLIQQQLDTQFLLPQERLERLRTMALLHLYEGAFLKATFVLEKARALIAAEPERLQKDVPTILFLQGIAALRRGEIENCVECGCDSSCIFPIRPQAVHQKPEGS